MKVTKFGFEAQLLRWTESSNGGATVVLQLQDADDLAIFKTMTLAKRGVVGQRLAVAVAEIDDDESLKPHELSMVSKSPAERKQAAQDRINRDARAMLDAATVVAYTKPDKELDAIDASSGAAQIAAVQAVTKAHFPGGFCGLAVRWCDDALFREWIAGEFEGEWIRSASMVKMTNKTADVDRAAIVIKLVCGVTSRTQLDTDAEAHRLFDEKIRTRYMADLEVVA